MNKFYPFILILLLLSCSEQTKNPNKEPEQQKHPIQNSSEESNNVSEEDLISAIKNEDPDEVRRTIDEGTNVNAKPTWDSKTPLILASEIGNLEVVKVLVENGADINLGTHEYAAYTCPVGAAIQSNNLNIIQFYVDQGVEINQCQPIWYVNPEDKEMFQYLMDQGMNINALRLMDTEYEVSRLSHALSEGKNDLVKFLIQNGAEVDKTTVMNLSSVDQFQPLIESGFNFSNVTDQIEETTGETGVYSILSFKDKEIVSAYLENGLNPTPNTIVTLFPCCDGQSERLKKETEIFNLVLKHAIEKKTVDINETYTFHKWVIYPGIAEAREDNKATLLGLAALADNSTAVKVLIDHGAKPDVPDNKGNLPIHYSQSEKVRLLFQKD